MSQSKGRGADSGSTACSKDNSRHSSRLRIAVLHATPSNTGDEALLQALLLELRRIRPDADIVIGCPDPELANRLMPGEQFFLDLEVALRRANPTFARIRRAVYRLLPSAARIELSIIESSSFDDVSLARVAILGADLVVSTPGGFLHDAYNPVPRLLTLQYARHHELPVAVIAQSLGPYRRRSSRYIAERVLRQLNMVTVRESNSLSHLASLGLVGTQFRLTGDIAFALQPQHSDTLRGKARGGPQRVAMSYRTWPPSHSGEREHVLAKATALTTWLLIRSPSLTIDFVSTCQGIPDYVDDSTLADLILSRLPPLLRMRCTVERNHLTAFQFLERLAKYDLYIGMRLHGAVLALLSGTPAIAIGYESKTREVFNSIGLGDLVADYRLSANDWIRVVSSGLDRFTELSQSIPSAVERGRVLTSLNTDALVELISGITERQSSQQ
jgi:colanic acid/amylovoran biosynthesis protein